MIEVRIKFFGAFRKYESSASQLQLDFEQPPTVQEIKTALGKSLCSKFPEFSDTRMIQDSALADDRKIFTNDERIVASGVLSILPPVCGG